MTSAPKDEWEYEQAGVYPGSGIQGCLARIADYWVNGTMPLDGYTCREVAGYHIPLKDGERVAGVVGANEAAQLFVLPRRAATSTASNPAGGSPSNSAQRSH